MATVDACVQKQKKEFVLQAPVSSSSTHAPESTTLTGTTMSVALVNNTSSSTVYAYISGLASDNNSAVFMLESDGETVYYPVSPSSTGSALSANCAIALGAPGSTTTVTIPRTAGGRIWFSRDATLTFLLNPGPALVEPSVTNVSDPNYNIYWDFCEFTFNAAELFINISYVDFVSMPIGLQLENTSGTVTTVEGLPANGLDTVCSGLASQNTTDSAGWSDLIITTSSGANLRALSPNSGITMNDSLFSTYWDSYVKQVWSKYSNSANLTVDTQASWSTIDGTISNDELSFGSSVGSFSAPSSADIFSCSSGPFATDSAQMGAIGARLAAAFNRSTLLIDAVQPDNEVVADYYQNSITNHYARLLHATYLDGKGYAFPYDDVGPSGGADQSGSLYDPNPQLLTVTVGGPSSSSKAVKLRDMATRAGQRPAGRRQATHQRIHRRDVGWMSAEDEKRMLADESGGHDGDDSGDKRGVEEELANTADVDLEKGLGPDKQALFGHGVHGGNHGPLETLSSSSSTMARSLSSLVPRGWTETATSLLARLEASPIYVKTRPMVELVVRLVALFLSMSVRALISRVTMALLLVLFYLVMPMVSGTGAGATTAPVGMNGDAVMKIITVDAVNVTSVLSTRQ